jgi:hypothetical protein
MGDVQNHPTAMAGAITPPLPSLPPSQRAEPPTTQSVIRQTRAHNGMSGRLRGIAGRPFAERRSLPIMRYISGEPECPPPPRYGGTTNRLGPAMPSRRRYEPSSTSVPACRGRVRQASRRPWRAGGAVHGAWGNTSRDLHAPALMATKPAAQQGRGPSLVPGGLFQDGDPCHYRRGIVAESTSG